MLGGPLHRRQGLLALLHEADSGIVLVQLSTEVFQEASKTSNLVASGRLRTCPMAARTLRRRVVISESFAKARLRPLVCSSCPLTVEQPRTARGTARHCGSADEANRNDDARVGLTLECVDTECCVITHARVSSYCSLVVMGHIVA